MKYLIAIILSAVAFAANAQHRHYGHPGHHHGHSGWGWVVPAIVGGAVVYGMTRPAAPPPQPAVVYVPQGYPPPPVGFHYEQLLDAHCNCYRWVLVQG